MSGIVGLVNLDGSPTDRGLLGRMTRSLAPRGPDQQATWADGPAGLGHALLRTTDESEGERQPLTLDGAVWVTADARIDDRAALVDKLAGQGRAASLGRPDAELVLHAYHAWGERCVGHLLGDFAFAVWDGRRRRLFCARDHFGVKPFFYAHVGDRFVFSNTLNCVRLHPDVSDELNDLAIADFLIFHRNQDVATTAFAAVRRLPPAHSLTVADGTARLIRYWTVPFDGEVRYRRQEEYAEHLRDLLRRAVEDRLRSRRVALLMSGGMDSSAIAAVARRLASPGRQSVDLKAFTVVFDSLIHDEERHFAGLAAEALDIPSDFLRADGYRLYEGWDRPELHTPEPSGWPCMLTHRDLLRRVAAHGRVVLTGQGADPAMHGSSAYALSLLTSGAWGRLAADVVTSLRRRYLPKLGLRARLRRWRRGPRLTTLPAWLRPGLADRLGLAERCRQASQPRTPRHARRPESWRELTSAFWPYMLEDNDPGVTGVPVEYRHPYFDVRVLSWLLAIPPLPWCDNKEVLRSAMAGLLPEPVRRRPKAPCSAQASLAMPIPLGVPVGRRRKAFVGADPLPALMRREESAWVDRFEAAPGLAEYVVRERIPPLFGETHARTIWTNLRPLSLNYWLPRRNDCLRAGPRLVEETCQ